MGVLEVRSYMRDDITTATSRLEDSMVQPLLQRGGVSDVYGEPRIESTNTPTATPTATATPTPTNTPVPTIVVIRPTYVVSAPAINAGREAAREVVCRPEFTWDCEWALNVVKCESGYNSGAVGKEIYRGELIYFYGWFQVHNGPLDPYQNTVEAHIQYVQWQKGIRSARPWPNCPS